MARRVDVRAMVHDPLDLCQADRRGRDLADYRLGKEGDARQILGDAV